MALSERRRREFFRAVSDALGEEHAVTMFEFLPPPGVDLATRTDVSSLEVRMDGLGGRMDGLEGRMDGLELRMGALEVRMDGLEGRMDRLEGRMGDLEGRLDRLDAQMIGLGARMDGLESRVDRLEAAIDHRFDEQNRYLDVRFDGLRDEMLASFRGELVTSVAGQTRAIAMSAATATFGIGGLAVALSQLL